MGGVLMMQEKFDEIVNCKIQVIKDSLATKGQEYVQGFDRLQAFKDAAKLRNTTCEDALGGMVSKQIVSLFSMIKIATNLANHDNYVRDTYDLWEEKITDIINYMILLDAILYESLNISQKGD